MNQELTVTNYQSQLSALKELSRDEITAITLQLQKQGIMTSKDTLEEWLAVIASQVNDGGNLTISEFLTGLKQFSQL